MGKLGDEKKSQVSAAFVLFLVLLATDQLTKYLAVRYLKGAADIVLIPGVFQLSYLELSLIHI